MAELITGFVAVALSKGPNTGRAKPQRQESQGWVLGGGCCNHTCGVEPTRLSAQRLAIRNPR